MKILHYSDAHIGMDTVGPIDSDTRINGRVLDYLDMIDSIIDFAIDEKVDLVVFTGDAFHRHDPNPVYLNEFSKRMMRLKDICPVVLLVGNHDIARSDRPSSVEIYNSLQVEGMIVANKYEIIDIETKSGKIQVGTLPYPTKYMLDSDERMAGKNDWSAIIRDKIKNIVIEMEKSLESGIPHILIGHFTVEHSIYGSEQGMYFDKDAEVRLVDIAHPVWDYVGLGHIHRHQCLNKIPPVVYAGSIDRVSFNEETEDKGFVLVTIDEKSTQWEFILLDARPYKTIEMSLLGKSMPMERIMKRLETVNVKDAVVRLRFEIEESRSHYIILDKLVQILDRKGMYCLGSANIKSIRDSLPRMNMEAIDAAMHPEVILEHFLRATYGDKELKELMSLGKAIMREVEENGN